MAGCQVQGGWWGPELHRHPGQRPCHQDEEIESSRGRPWVWVTLTGMRAGDGLLQSTGKLCYNYNVSPDQLSDVTPAPAASWAETVHYGTLEQDAALQLWAHHCILAAMCILNP